MTDQVIIDLQASPRQPTEAALEGWGAEQRVFISSVMQGLELERQAVAAAVERIGAEPVMFERFGGRDDAPDKAYLSGSPTRLMLPGSPRIQSSGRPSLPISSGDLASAWRTLSRG
jgi:hypothetical protein